MIVTPKAAFGYVLNLCTTEPGETRTVQLDETGRAASGHYFYVDGRVISTVQGTDEQLTDRVAGWLSCEHDNRASTPNGVLNNSFPEGAQWVCIARQFNQTQGLPDVASLVLEDQVTETLTNGTDLYLVRGVLLIGDKTFTGPTQIRVRSGAVTATSQGKSYSLRFL
jgi:hypothetical protein